MILRPKLDALTLVIKAKLGRENWSAKVFQGNRPLPPCGRKRLAHLLGIGLTISTLVGTPSVTASLAAGQGKPTRFWNLTRNAISELHLAPTGTSNWGPNQCKNDPDGAVDTDERLPITGAPPGMYDAKLMDTSGRVCIVRNIKVEPGKVFSIDENDLNSCNP